MIGTMLMVRANQGHQGSARQRAMQQIIDGNAPLSRIGGYNTDGILDQIVLNQIATPPVATTTAS